MLAFPKFPKEDIDTLESEFGEVSWNSAVVGPDSVSVLICSKSHFVSVDYYGPGWCCYGIRTGENDGCSSWRFDSLKSVMSFIRNYEKELSQRKYRMNLFLGIIKSGLEDNGELYALKSGLFAWEHIYVGSELVEVRGNWFNQKAILDSPKISMTVEGKDIDGDHAMKFLATVLEIRSKQRGGHEG